MPDAIETLRGVTTATLTLQLIKRGYRNVAMRGVEPLHEMSERLVGRAYTLRFVPMREDLSTVESLADRTNPARRAIEEAPEGSVLVIDARGEPDYGVIGDILALRLLARGVAGLVTDGAVRDAEALAATEFPVWCGGLAAPASIHGHASGDVDVVIGCGGVAVVPGDVIVADTDGAVVIPAALVDEVARDGAEQERLERFVQLKIRRGAPVFGTYPPDDATRAEYQEWIAAGEPED